jgi:hypothetical protein
MAENLRDPTLQLARAVAARNAGPSQRRRRPTRRQFMIRRLVTATVALTVLGLLGDAIYRVVSPGPSGRAVAVRPPPRSTTIVPRATEPGGGSTLFPSHRLVAFYGAPDRPRLGVLGDAPPDVLWDRLTAAAAPYSSPPTILVPGYELIAFLADAAPGPTGIYTEELPTAQIDSYLQVVHAHGGMLILDVQPGRSDFLGDAQALAPWLSDPDVGLALDPEWELAAGQLPGKQVGHTTAAEINQVSAWLEQLTVADHLPQKLLMVHQFLAATIADKDLVVPRPHLAITFNMDGFGDTANKAAVYQILAADPRWSLGYKLFYTRDRTLQTPAEVLALSPAPQIVEYE